MQTENNKGRQSNIELLRILLMITIPVYHLMLYNGVFYIEYNANTVLGILLSAAGAIPADYGFVALSSYFLCSDKESAEEKLFGVIPIYKRSLRRFMEFATLCLSMYVIKVVVLRSLFGYNNKEYFVDFFLMKGAWWYVYPYLLLLLLYPFLNNIFSAMDDKKHLRYVVLSGVLFFLINLNNTQHFIFDFYGFFFVYSFISYLKKREMDHMEKKVYGIVAIICAVILIGVCVYVKIPASGVDLSTADWIVKRLIGRYSFVACIMGISVFLFFKNIRVPYNPFINWFAKSVVFVFLLHDTWMGVFWYLGKCDNRFAYYSTGQFLFWIEIFTDTSFLVAVVIGELYRRGIKPLWDRLIQKII